MTDTILAQLAALKDAPVGDLKQKWRDLFEREPPPYNRRFLESRLAYRIQELAYGGLSEETIERLDALADELEGKPSKRPQRATQDRPIAGTRLIRNGEASNTASRSGRTTSNSRGARTNPSQPLPARSPARSGTGLCFSA